MDDAFYLPLGHGRFGSTELTRGPWGPDAQHAGPPIALVGWSLETSHPREDALIARITAEILRPVPIAPLDVETHVVRSGRKVELLGATLRAGGTEILRVTAWRLRVADIGMQVEPPVAAPRSVESSPPGPFFDGAPDVGYHTAMEFRFASGAFAEPGPATVWMRPRVPLVADAPLTPLVRVLVAADSGNGVSAVAHPRDALFVNTDLSVSLRRHLAGEWVCLDAQTRIARTGIGLAASVLHDETGPVGASQQTLYVEPR
jgi:hypothetical protein